MSSVIWKPALINNAGSAVAYIPRPIQTLQVVRNWNHEKHEAPLRDGTDIRGARVKGPEITITGNTNIEGSSYPGTPIAEESIHFTAVEQIRALETLGKFLTDYESAGFRFAEFWIGTDPVVQFKNCFPFLFQYDGGDGSRVTVPYTLILHVNNPRCYFNIDTNGDYSSGGSTFGPEFVGG